MDPAIALLDLFAKQIIHRTLGHAEFDAEYARLRAELTEEEPITLTEEDVDGLTIKEGDAPQTGN